MTLQERIINFEQLGRLEKIPKDKNNINNIFINAQKSYEFANSAMSAYANNYDYDNKIFTNFYDSIRLGFSSLLVSYGYKTTSKGGHHSTTFNFGQDILIEEISKIIKDEEEIDKIKNTFKQIKGITEDRSDALYGPAEKEISRTDLEVLSDNIKYLLSKIKIVIEN